MEYKYITQEIIEKGNVNITSPEMFEEARRYNIEAVKNYKKRYGIKIAFGLWIAAQVIYVIFCVVNSMDMQNSYDRATRTSMPAWQIALRVLGVVAYLGLMFWFAFHNGSRDKKTLCLASLPIICFSLYFAGIPLGNYIIGYLYERSEDYFSKQLGYPSFPRLVTNSVYSSADNLKDLSYDSIRDKARRDHPDDGSFL
ncbi:MAG: hypothetical protein J6U00_09030 [Ruminococcus sp.]|uniref:hypothetical protein n=1 Tax=Ruminococcus sp. TaxID=41978 RepID=UPI001B16D392|nr:hypothetical protein [Ruminococcus sp.]MBO7474125.1 hypothetical protein [Ruminococcus sp.]